MSDQDKSSKTELPTPKKLRDAAEKGDVLASRELGTALVVTMGAAWIALAGPAMVGALETMVRDGLSLDFQDVRIFDPAGAALRLLAIIAIPIVGLFALTMLAAIGAPALLGSLGFRGKAVGFKASKLNPASGLKRIFGLQGLIELGKSLLKVILIGSLAIWLLMGELPGLIGLGTRDTRAAIYNLGGTFVFTVLLMAGALIFIAMIDVPMQMLQRTRRLKMSKQEIKDEHKQQEGSPEVKGQQRARQREVARRSVQKAMGEATVVLTNPTHFAVALRYKQGSDPAPILLARGRGVTAEAIRELAAENDVPMLSYPELTRAIYYTTRAGQFVREDLYLAVATVLAFVFNLEAARAAGHAQPPVEVPPEARFDADGRRVR
ncbi:MAG: flagellar type III secretion system protein FlhB [Allosphingosinicella sp.]|uniref:flagellar type III secretion system protein FlhB n=1 Tax=Allosphingosinicella sp. TaxID=2823234 RepID=UPI0039278098